MLLTTLLILLRTTKRFELLSLCGIYPVYIYTEIFVPSLAFQMQLSALLFPHTDTTFVFLTLTIYCDLLLKVVVVQLTKQVV